METIEVPLLIGRLARLCRRGEEINTLIRAYGLTEEEQDLLKMVLESATPLNVRWRVDRVK